MEIKNWIYSLLIMLRYVSPAIYFFFALIFLDANLFLILIDLVMFFHFVIKMDNCAMSFVCFCFYAAVKQKA